MRTDVCKTVELGELVEAVFDVAIQYSADPREVSPLATRAVLSMLRRARKASLLRRRHLRKAKQVASPDVGNA